MHVCAITCHLELSEQHDLFNKKIGIYQNWTSRAEKQSHSESGLYSLNQKLQLIRFGAGESIHYTLAKVLVHIERGSCACEDWVAPTPSLNA